MRSPLASIIGMAAALGAEPSPADRRAVVNSMGWGYPGRNVPTTTLSHKEWMARKKRNKRARRSRRINRMHRR